jgi:opine dehydrogenase
MKVAIFGGGAIGLAYAALLLNAGHEVRIATRSCGTVGEAALRVEGAVAFSGSVHHAHSIGEAADWADVLICTRRAPGVQDLVEALLPHVRPSQTLIFSAELSFSAFYAHQRFAAAGRGLPVVAWSTTVATAQRRPDGRIVSSTLRDRIDYATVGARTPDDSGEICEALFGKRFHRLSGALAVALSNLNPPIHLANGLANLTRIETGEDWDNYANITPAVGRVIERLDTERLALAGRFGLNVRSVFEHYLRTFPGISAGSVSEMASQVSAKGPRTPGPTSIDTRYLTEDIPFGLVPLVELARLAGVPMPLHEAGIALAGAYTGRDFTTENTMLASIRESWSVERMSAL